MNPSHSKVAKVVADLHGFLDRSGVVAPDEGLAIGTSVRGVEITLSYKQARRLADTTVLVGEPPEVTSSDIEVTSSDIGLDPPLERLARQIVGRHRFPANDDDYLVKVTRSSMQAVRDYLFKLDTEIAGSDAYDSERSTGETLR